MYRLVFALILGIPINMIPLSLAAQPELNIEAFASGFSIPVDITNAGDDRLFVVEKGGKIQIITGDGNTLETPFLDISSQTDPRSNERGLLGLSFHPNYVTNGYFFINYTNLEGTSIISRFSRSANDPNIANPESEKIIMTINQPFGNHNGGDLGFGPDGYLYIGMGDGGSAGDPDNRSQNNATLLGKMLRIDINTDDDNIPYTIPQDNPFVTDSTVLDEIWATGLRNPWRFSFDAVTGDMWIGDVGQNQREEINFQPFNSLGGENYGWRCYEGTRPFRTNDCPPVDSLTAPVYEYPHRTDDGCGGSVTGGEVYRGSKYLGLFGYYIYADYCSGTISGILQNQFGGFDNVDFLVFGNNQLTTFGTDSNGEIYVAAVQQGTIYAITGQETTSTAQAFAFDQFEFGPNPVEDELMLRFQTKESGSFLLRLSNLNGQILYESQEIFAPTFNKNISMQAFPSGVYYLQIQSGNQVSNWKIIKN